MAVGASEVFMKVTICAPQYCFRASEPSQEQDSVKRLSLLNFEKLNVIKTAKLLNKRERRTDSALIRTPRSVNTVGKSKI